MRDAPKLADFVERAEQSLQRSLTEDESGAVLLAYGRYRLELERLLYSTGLPFPVTPESSK